MDQNNQSVEKLEKKILKEEKEIREELSEEKKEIKFLSREVMILGALIVFVIGGGIAGFAYWKVSSNQVYIENSTIAAPKIDLSPHGSGILNDVYVREGDVIPADMVVARVGDELIKAKVAGEVISVQNNIGQLINPGQAVVSMIQPSELRVEGSIEEDKGLSDIKIGQKAVFTVDAFGSKQYQGAVDEISPTSKDSDVVFNISNEREVKQFIVKIRFNTDDYPELKNGMSAKIWIYKNS